MTSASYTPNMPEGPSISRQPQQTDDELAAAAADWSQRRGPDGKFPDEAREHLKKFVIAQEERYQADV